MFLCFFYLQINVFNIYAANGDVWTSTVNALRPVHSNSSWSVSIFVLVLGASLRWQCCPSRDVRTICLQCSWWLVICVRLTLSLHHVHGLSKYFIICSSLALLLTTFPLTSSFSEPFLLISWPKKSNCLCRTAFSNVRCTPATLSSYKLLFFSVCAILSIRHHKTKSTIPPAFPSLSPKGGISIRRVCWFVSVCVRQLVLGRNLETTGDRGSVPMDH